MFQRYIPLLLIALLVPIPFFGISNATTRNEMRFSQSEKPYVYINSTDYNVLSSIISKIEEERSLRGSWEFPADSNDSRVFFGLVGMAGLGMRFLTAMQKLSILPESQRAKLLTFAEQIADELSQHALVDNSTHLIIPVESNNSMVDYGYDFGLAGISSFYSLLYNMTEKVTYKNNAYKILNAISTAVNQTDGIHWNSQLFPLLNNTDWYPYFDFIAVNQTTPSFLGIAFGTAGVVKASLEYLQLTGDATNSTVKEILNDSIAWILGQKTINVTEVTFPIVSEVSDVFTSSWASGIAGLLDLFATIQAFDQTYGLQDEIDGMVDWLVGINEEFPRIGVTWFNATGEIFDQVEYGKRFGSIGTIDVLLRLNLSSTNVFDALDEELLNFLFIGDDEDGMALYPERIDENFLIREGSISYEFGSGGMIEVLSKVNQTDFPYIEGLAAKIKASLYRLIDQESLLFLDPDFNNINFNPMNGLPSVLEYLNTDLEGEPFVPSTTLEFGRLNVTENSSRTIRIANFGDGTLKLSLNASNSNFEIPFSSYEMDEWTLLILNVVFSPLAEGEITGEVSISFIDLTYNSTGNVTVSLVGVGIVPPSIVLVSPNNGTKVNGTVNFVFTITDDSGIKSATYSIFKEDFENSVKSGSLAQSGSNYILEINSIELGNGTFSLTVIAIDFLDVTTEVNVTFTVENIISGTTPEETVNLLLWILGSLTILAAIGATVFTVRYVRRSNT